MIPITTGFKQTPTNLVSVLVRLYLFRHGCPAGSFTTCCYRKPSLWKVVGSEVCRAHVGRYGHMLMSVDHIKLSKRESTGVTS